MKRLIVVLCLLTLALGCGPQKSPETTFTGDYGVTYLNVDNYTPIESLTTAQLQERVNYWNALADVEMPVRSGQAITAYMSKAILYELELMRRGNQPPKLNIGVMPTPPARVK